jgi:hypothetical protein
MTVTQQMAAAEQYAQLWTALMPESEVPGTDQFLLWAGQHSENIVTRGINRAAAKVRKMRDTAKPMTLDDAMKYAASVMKNESLGIRQHKTRELELTA